MSLLSFITAISIYCCAFSSHTYSGMNENNNPAYGLKVNETINYVHYSNSVYRESDAVFLSKFYDFNEIIQYGFWMGAVSGYKENWIPVAIPVFKIGGNTLFFNIWCLPSFNLKNDYMCASVVELEF